MRLVRHGVEGQHNPGKFICQSLGIGSFQQAGTEHVVQCAVASFVDCVALGMVGRGEDLLNPERAQEVGSNGANALPAWVGEKPSGGAKVGDDMPHEGLTDCARGVITGGDENSILQEAIHEGNQEFVVSIGR